VLAVSRAMYVEETLAAAVAAAGGGGFANTVLSIND